MSGLGRNVPQKIAYYLILIAIIAITTYIFQTILDSGSIIFVEIIIFFKSFITIGEILLILLVLGFIWESITIFWTKLNNISDKQALLKPKAEFREYPTEIIQMLIDDIHNNVSKVWKIARENVSKFPEDAGLWRDVITQIFDQIPNYLNEYLSNLNLEDLSEEKAFAERELQLARAKKQPHIEWQWSLILSWILA